MKRSTRYKNTIKLIDRTKLHSVDEAVQLLKKTATAKFDETVELAAKLGVDPRNADQNIRGTVTLPHGTGKSVRVIAFAQGEKLKEAGEAGADAVGGEDLAEKIQGGWLDFDAVVAAPDMMRVVSKLGRILGPKGLMPNPKSGTVSLDMANMIRDIKAGKIEYRVDRTAIIHVPVGKTSFKPEQLKDNINTVVDALIKARPSSAKGKYLYSVAVASTMGPGVKLDITLFT